MPKPRVNLTRFHGVLAPNKQYRARVTPGKRGRGGLVVAAAEAEEPTAAERRASMTWAQRLRRVFNIDLEICSACGGAVRIVACIEAPEVIGKLLAHLERKTLDPETSRPPSRGAPQWACSADLFQQSVTRQAAPRGATGGSFAGYLSNGLIQPAGRVICAVSRRFAGMEDGSVPVGLAIGYTSGRAKRVLIFLILRYSRLARGGGGPGNHRSQSSPSIR